MMGVGGNEKVVMVWRDDGAYLVVKLSSVQWEWWQPNRIRMEREESRGRVFSFFFFFPDSICTER